MLTGSRTSSGLQRVCRHLIVETIDVSGYAHGQTLVYHGTLILVLRLCGETGVVKVKKTRLGAL